MPAEPRDAPGPTLPPGFLWGAATAAHQVEGDNTHSDWWAAETAGLLPVASGRACAHRQKFPQDLDLMAAAGLNAYRFSVEWARIQPDSDTWDDAELARYVEMVHACRERGITPLLTLYHFSLPAWVARRGGWLWAGAVPAFAAYVRRVVLAVGDAVDLYATVNEPVVLALQAYLHGAWPPLRRSLGAALAVSVRLTGAHKAAYAAIRTARPDARVGCAKHVLHFRALSPGRLGDTLMAAAMGRVFNEVWLDAVSGGLDWIGVNYYTTMYCAAGAGRGFLLPALVRSRERPQTEIGWEVHPEGLRRVLGSLARFGRPIYITENGIATLEDAWRLRFLRRHLLSATRAIADGVDVRGYFHWSLMDNYEWAEGYGMHFGLIGVERRTLERDVRPSLGYLGAMAQRNAVLPLPVPGPAYAEEGGR